MHRAWALALAVLAAACASPAPVDAQPARPEVVTPRKTKPEPTTRAPKGPVSGQDFILPEGQQIAMAGALGPDGMVFVTAGKAHALDRSGASIEGRAPDGARGVADHVDGSTRIAVVFGGRGEYSLLRGTMWEHGLAPALDGEDLAGATIDPSGVVSLAGRHRALYVREGDAWKVHRYPPGAGHVAGLTRCPDGTTFLVTATARVLSFTAGVFKDLAVSGVTAQMLEEPWEWAWCSPKTTSLYAVSGEWLMKIDPATGATRGWPIPLFFDVDAATGVAMPTGDIIVVATMSDSALFDGTSFYKVATEGSHPKALFVDATRAVVHHFGMSKPHVLPIVHPAFGTGKGEVLTER